MKKLLLIATLLMVLGSSNAYAFPVTFNIDQLYDWGRLYSYSGGVGGIYTPTNVNPAPWGTNPAGGYTITADTLGNADLAEDSWGIGSVASVTSNPPGTTYWDRITSGEELTFMFAGFNDDALSSPNMFGEVTIGSIGGHVSVYLDSTPDFNGGLGTGGRTSLASYTGVTDGLLLLDLAPMANPFTGFTLTSGFNFTTNTGSGSTLLSTTGLGAWDYLFDTNTQLFGADFALDYTVRNNVSPTVGNWVVRGDGSVEADMIPEPTSMLLFGVGMLGLGAIRRKRAA